MENYNILLDICSELEMMDVMQVLEWMNELMDEWMNEWMNGKFIQA